MKLKQNYMYNGELDWGEIVRKVEHAIEFIEKGEC